MSEEARGMTKEEEVRWGVISLLVNAGYCPMERIQDIPKEVEPVVRYILDGVGD